MSKVTRLAGPGQRETRRGQLHLRDVSAEAEAPLGDVGQELRAERLRRGDELGHIARALRIRKDYLEAIESGSPEKLPGRTYALGFLRSYADYLGLDSRALVSRYKRQIPGQNEDVPQVGPPPEPGNSRFGLAKAFAAMAIVGAGIYGFYQISQSAGPDRPFAASAPFAHAVPAAAHRATHPSQLQVQLQPRRLASADGEAAVAPAAPSSAEQQTGAAEGQVFGAKNLNARVVLHARGPAHLLVQGAEGKVYINRVLHPGDVYRVPNLVGLSLTTRDGNALSVELDGRDLGAAGRAGQITEALSLDPGAIADRKGIGSPYGNNKVTR